MPTFVNNFTALISGRTWASGTGLPAVVTYSFETRAPGYVVRDGFSQGFANSFQSFTSQQEGLAERAMDEISAESGIIFVEVPAGQGDIRFGNYNFGQSSFSANNGYAYYPYRYVDGNGTYEFDLGGDVFINTGSQNGSRYGLILHEIGHAVGLKHPHDGEVQLQSQYDNGTYSVMSYNRDWDSGLGSFDGDALRHIYGPVKFSPKGDGGMEAFNYNEDKKIVTQSWGDASSDILGSSLRDEISGGRGDDNIGGFRGRDTISGNGGNDAIFGGADNDRLAGGKGNDLLEGGKGNDRAVGQAGDDTLRGEDGDDRLNGGGGVDMLSGGRGDDFLKGGTRADMLYGGPGNERIFGNRDDDLLHGEAGRDKLNGGGGNDTLDGGPGRDTLKGGDGADVFVFSEGETRDVVEDFEPGVDFVMLDLDMLGSVSTGQQVVDRYGAIKGGDAVLNFGDGNVIRFEGVSDLDLLADQIVFF